MRLYSTNATSDSRRKIGSLLMATGPTHPAEWEERGEDEELEVHQEQRERGEGERRE